MGLNSIDTGTYCSFLSTSNVFYINMNWKLTVLVHREGSNQYRTYIDIYGFPSASGGEVSTRLTDILILNDDKS